MSAVEPQMDLKKAMFMNLVVMLSATAMQQLGKVVSPMTQKIELDLQGAQATIEMLVMLQAKTQGNLDDEENRLVDQTLSALQLNYVETAEAAKSAPADSDDDDEAEEEEEAAPATDGDEGDAPAGKDPKDPKFHKSYD
jgi:hypothetical protein